jgi:GT2 family glycosyltransferase
MTEVINTFVFPIVRMDYILPALQSLRRFTPANYRTIVVNQTQCNETFERNLWEAADYVIRTHYNLGFAQAVNLGTRLAPTPWVTVCNDDVLFFNAQWWPGIMETFERFPTALGVTPMSPKEPGWGWGEEGYRMHAELDECRENPAGVVDRLKKQFNGAVIDGFPAWLVVFRREEWMELGMFDERFNAGGEDYDGLCRAYQAGYRMLASSYSWVWHWWGQSKDEPDGLNWALPRARDPWNKLSTKGFGDEGLWDPDLHVWGENCTRTDPNVFRAPL